MVLMVSVIVMFVPEGEFLICFSSLQYEGWNEHDRLLRGYIKTRMQPPIFFRPVRHIPRTEELQQQSTAKIEGL